MKAQEHNKIMNIFYQEKTMSLFKQDFRLEKRSSEHYMRLQKGENKIRVLSQFIGGWEEWDENRKPIRYREKPESPREGCRQFAAAVVWNYQEGKIQVLELTQTGIIRSLQNLSEDKDWGPVFHYDVKITRTGEDKLTRYAVNPLPAKPLDPKIVQEFKAKRCWLEALFESEDPFGAHPQYTEGVFEEKSTISEEQAQEIDKLIGDDLEFRTKFVQKLKKAFSSDSFYDIPIAQYQVVKGVVLDHNKERIEREMGMTA